MGNQKYIGYAEFVVDFPECDGMFPKMTDNFSDEPIPHKREIISYLRGCNVGAMCMSWMTDIFTGERVKGIYDDHHHDDVYSWGESLAYYVEKYDLMLPEDFLQHIYRKLKIED